MKKMNDMNEIDLYLNTLDITSDVRDDLHYKLLDIKKRGVKPQLVESYCKSLGWSPDVVAAWEGFNQWMFEQERATENAIPPEPEIPAKDATDVARALLSRLLADTVGAAKLGMSLEEMYSAIVSGYKKLELEVTALEAELTALETELDASDSSADVSLAVNNLMVGFLRKTGYSDADLSEMSLAEMSSRIEHYMVAVDALATVAMDKDVES
jgi:hypothetical protein